MRLNPQLAKYYYTTAQARKVLGLDEEAFQYWVRKGRVTKVKLPGRVQGVYSRREVDKLANKVETTILTEYPEETEFRKATINDLEQEAQLAHLVFGEKAEAFNERKAFLERNPDIDYHVYDDDKLVAYIDIVPLKHNAIEDFMNARIGAWSINPEDILEFVPEKPLECLIIDMVTTPTVPPRKRSAYGSRLLSGLIDTLSEMGRHGIDISKLYAASETPAGIRILKNAGFQVTGEHRRGRFSFELDISNSDEKVLRPYKEVLAEWKSQKTTDRKHKKQTAPRSQPE